LRPGEAFPADQAEIVFSDAALDWMAEHLTAAQVETVIDDVMSLLTAPAGKHALSNRPGQPLAGMNTTATVGRMLRIVFRSRVEAGTGLLEVVAIGPRSDDAVYDAVSALVNSGKLTDAEVAQIWDAIEVFEAAKDRLGLESWDYRPAPAPDGLIRAVVNLGLLERGVAELLSDDELQAAQVAGWQTGTPDPAAALDAALQRVEGSSSPERLLTIRAESRCGAPMPRSKKKCIRRRDHAGAHRGMV
jgi:hypothetical protein